MLALALGFAVVVAAAPVTGPRVLLVYDMEGVTAAAAPRDVQMGGANYPATRESLTEDVNAAIRGLIKAGAAEVVITDAHGSGNPEPDYLIDRLPTGARFDLRDVPYDPFVDVVDGRFAAVVAVGMHARAGKRGFLPHTFLGHTRWIIAGHELSESHIVAASAARFGVPLILVTGDDVLKEQLAPELPSTEYVVVKKALSATEVEMRPRDEVSREIESVAARALANVTKVKPWTPAGIDGAIENEFGYALPEMASLAINFPGARSVNDKTIALRTQGFREAYLAFKALVFFTAEVRFRLRLDNVSKVEGGPEALERAQALWPTRDKRTFEPTAAAVDTRRSAFGSHGAR
jgi:D-amino peptidase